jgi:DNA polymerase elongation subunit (family B)
MLRQQNQTNKTIIKLLVNSFYGRLGLNKKLNITHISQDKPVDEFLQLNSFFLKNSEINQKNFKSNIIAASIITSRARIKLFKAFHYLQTEQCGELLYCDTDSIIIAFPKSIIIENKKLPHEIYFDTSKNDTEIDEAVFVAPKFYALRFKNHPLRTYNDVIKIKGVTDTSISFDEIKTAFQTNKPILLTKRSLFKNNHMEYTIETSKIEISTNNYSKRQ